MLLMGLDCGSSAIKAALFDEAGRTIAVARRGVVAVRPAPGHVEQDMAVLWRSSASAIAEAIDLAGAAPGKIACVGVTGHGDGLYLTDRGGQPLGNGIQSVDNRGSEITRNWSADGLWAQAEALTGQRPSPYAATTLLRWIKRRQPERFAAIGRVLFVKDWLRFCLTGAFATDPTDASTAFTNPHSQDYDPAILNLFGLESITGALPPILPICGRIGAVTDEAARLTGLIAGTPVSGGLQDVTASAIGLGNLEPGALTVTADTFSINETLSQKFVCDPRWSTRAGLKPGQWMNMAISPTSSNNVDWFLSQAYGAEVKAARRRRISAWWHIDGDLAPARSADDPFFHPFLYGSPFGEPASAGFFGLRSWHSRAHMLRAVLEGAILNHRAHAEALASAFPMTHAGIAGGGSSTPRVAKYFADALGMPVHIPEAKEVGALGVAIAAGVGVGLYASLEQGALRACRDAARYAPDAEQHAAMTLRFERYGSLIEALRPLWRDSSAGPEAGYRQTAASVSAR
jgi:L-xylulokinase